MAAPRLTRHCSPMRATKPPRGVPTGCPTRRIGRSRPTRRSHRTAGRSRWNGPRCQGPARRCGRTGPGRADRRNRRTVPDVLALGNASRPHVAQRSAGHTRRQVIRARKGRSHAQQEATRHAHRDRGDRRRSRIRRRTRVRPGSSAPLHRRDRDPRHRRAVRRGRQVRPERTWNARRRRGGRLLRHSGRAHVAPFGWSADGIQRRAHRGCQGRDGEHDRVRRARRHPRGIRGRHRNLREPRRYGSRPAAPHCPIPSRTTDRLPSPSAGSVAGERAADR